MNEKERAVMEQALEFCKFLWQDVAMNDYAEEKREAVEAALRSVLALPRVDSTACRDTLIRPTERD